MRLLKRLCYACLLLLGAVCLAACNAPAEQAAEQADAPATYYNDYLGLSLCVPPGWQINSLSANLSTQQGETAAPQLLEYGDGSRRLELIDIQSSALSSDAEHSRFCAYAELFTTTVETAQYVELLVSLLEADSGGYTYTLQKQEQLPLALHTAQRICLQVTAQGHEQAYTVEYYIIPLGMSFVVLYLDYWPQNDASRAAATAMLDNISLPAL